MTAANIMAGFAAILSATEGRLEIAVYLLYLAVWLDMADGRLARHFKATSRLGMELDSLSDALSFGAAPAFLAYRASLHELGAVGMLVAIAYLLAAVFRLGRYNVLSDYEAKSGRTMGLPVPAAAGYLMAIALMRDQIPPVASAVVVLLMAVSMVSTVRLPEFKGGSIVTALLSIGLLTYTALVIWPSWTTVAVWNVWNLVIFLAARREDRGGVAVADRGSRIETG
ncbi:MAG: CDP-diacylglycerol--serine O-phosphatidyltransferase [Thermoanaerobaculia bacterium]|nr:CDP-diacylglycerol--serine O-phosphatidyltransferase [Thermoanaerobaculia bacterium]